ncbi:hypothetical protein [Pseudomonas sp. NKUCC02_KPG]|uniref:hypothetical protein n=1 Tax=Pseudomonas sp. NKUCC02_KPG TaxID=2842124 RepID=UPI001C5A61D6|nr:hypothetical protein [Pseudomonas sp. NKUCC02_KPG]MBW3504668.1 hypothetical protein [Pseudomonas sp. NKUCC02_KPG]
MFRTYRRDVMIFSSQLEPDLQLWSCVEQIIPLPWFYVTALKCGADSTSRHMLMVSDVQTLEDLSLSKSASVAIESILLATPPAMNGKERWLMEQLIEIAYVPKSKGSIHHYRFSVKDGPVYTNSCDPGLEVEQGNIGRVVISLCT